MFGHAMIFYYQVDRITVAKKLSYLSVDCIAFIKIVSAS